MSDQLLKYLADPRPGLTLDELAKELNELGKIRDRARIAFCQRLAVAYLMIVGHTPRRGRDTVSAAQKFYKWCYENLKTANGKQYTYNTLSRYVAVGFAKNPTKALYQRDQNSQECRARNVSIAHAVTRAVMVNDPPKVIPIPKLKAQGMPTDVAREVNALMTAWEQASSQARSQFMYIVTGKRIAA